MRRVFSARSQDFLAALNNPYVELAAIDSLQRLTRLNFDLKHPDPEGAGLKVLEHIHGLPLSSSQPNAVFNSGGVINFQNRQSFLSSHSKSTYGDWHLPSTAWINNNFPHEQGEVRLSLFNFNSALMAMQAARDNKNVIPFTEGLSFAKSPKAIWPNSEFPALLHESLYNPRAADTTVLGMKLNALAQSIGSRHLQNAEVIYPLSHSLGKEVGDGKQLDFLTLKDKEVSITVSGKDASKAYASAIAHLSDDPSLKFYFDFPARTRIQDASSVPLTPPVGVVSPTLSSGLAQPGRTPDPHATVVGPLPTQTTVTTPGGGTQPLINDRAHPDNKLFQQALAAVNQLDRQQHRTSDVHSEQLAAALTAAALRNDLKQIDHVELSKDNTHVFAIQGDPKAIDRRQIAVNTLDGLNTPVEKSSQALQLQKAQTPQRDDPRHPDNPAHAEFQGVRQLVNDLHARHGVPLSEEQRDRLAAAVIHDAHNNQLGPVRELRFSEDKAGKIQPDGHVFAFNGDPTKVTTLHSATPIPQAQETPVEQSFKQMAKAMQQPQEQQQQAAQSQAPGTPVSSHPGGR